eukprot:7737985-Karenia_brevis.AAC.1
MVWMVEPVHWLRRMLAQLRDWAVPYWQEQDPQHPCQQTVAPELESSAVTGALVGAWPVVPAVIAHH